MPQLSDDCFALGDAPLSVEAAAALIAQRVSPLPGEESVGLMAARGRVLARAVHAPIPLPPFANSAVDGYAFRHADCDPVAATTPLRLVGRLAAGQTAKGRLPAGTTLRIFTGAPMPPGADTVLMQEDARVADGMLLVPRGLKPGANARPAGEDLPRGAVALPMGRRLRAPEIGLAAALGLTALPVRPLLRVGVFSTGDELAAPGSALGPAQAHDSNRFTLLALLAGLPAAVTDLGILPDDPAATGTALIAAAGAHDLLLTSGGVSMGEEDHVRAAIEASGRLVFWKLAVKPGRPAAMGVVAGTPVIGLPGNPVAAVVNFLLLARPLLLRLVGALEPPPPRFPACADFTHRKKPGRREYLRVRLVPGPDGIPVARKSDHDGAGVLSTLVESDAFAELPEEATLVQPGQVLQVLPFAALF